MIIDGPNPGRGGVFILLEGGSPIFWQEHPPLANPSQAFHPSGAQTVCHWPVSPLSFDFV